MLVFVVLLAAYPWIGPAYQKTIATLASSVTSTFSPPTRIETPPDGAWRYMARLRDGRVLETVRFDRTGVRMATLNLLLLPSLLLATPVGWRRRLALCGIGLIVLLGLQTMTAILWAKTSFCLVKDPDDALCNWLFYAFVTGGQFYAIAIWGLLTWRVWLPGGPATTDPDQPISRNAACPCGSGRKYKHCCAQRRGDRSEAYRRYQAMP